MAQSFFTKTNPIQGGGVSLTIMLPYFCWFGLFFLFACIFAGASHFYDRAGFSADSMGMAVPLASRVNWIGFYGFLRVEFFIIKTSELSAK